MKLLNSFFKLICSRSSGDVPIVQTNSSTDAIYEAHISGLQKLIDDQSVLIKKQRATIELNDIDALQMKNLLEQQQRTISDQNETIEEQNIIIQKQKAVLAD